MNGLIEQWGEYINTLSSYNLNVNIPLFISYSDTKYKFFRSNCMPNSVSSASAGVTTLRLMMGYNTKAVNSVTVGAESQGNMPSFDWKTIGY